MIYKLIGLSESGTRVGETHHRAKLTDHDIDLIRELHEEGLSYKVIAEKFQVGKSTVADIVKCRRRWQLPVKWRRSVVDNTFSNCLNQSSNNNEELT